ncbi:MAG: hypothetical protein JSW34_08090 [Candidatus Zixiibacteriota bacterium]|nr:MAG: hypothetical protein JSW34_08090 [candidate division Zixibacteria bacterium]
MFPAHISRAAVLLIAVAAITSKSTASVGVSLEHRFTIPGFYRPIQKVAMADIDGDSAPEALASDGESVILYSPQSDITLFSGQLRPGHVNYSILLGDVNGDEATDIMIGYYFDLGIYGPDTVCMLDWYDGSSAFATRDSAFFEIDAGGLEALHSPFLSITLQALDIDENGSSELLFSYDRHRVVQFGGYRLLSTTGCSRLYDSYPRSMLWERPHLLGSINLVAEADGASYLAGTRYESFSTIPGDSRATGWVEIITGGGDSITSISEPLQPSCTGDSSDIYGFSEYLCTGDIRGDDYDEVLVMRRWGQTCYEGDAVSDSYHSSVLRLYRFIPPDITEIVWSVTESPGYSSFFYLPSHPGTFFAIQDDVVHRLSGENGSVLDQSAALGADTMFWNEIPGVANGGLVAVENQTVSIYDLDVATSAEPEQPLGLPSSFALGNPYPNPFNPWCTIEYSLPRRCHVRLAVYNVLGQKVATLVDGVKPAGRFRVVWDGTDGKGKPVASGTYLFRMESGEFKSSKKILLLK